MDADKPDCDRTRRVPKIQRDGRAQPEGLFFSREIPRASLLNWRLRRTTIGGRKKSLLDLLCNLIQPFLSAVRPIPIVPDIRLKVLYSVFGGSKLKRKFVSNA